MEEYEIKKDSGQIEVDLSQNNSNETINSIISHDVVDDKGMFNPFGSSKEEESEQRDFDFEEEEKPKVKSKFQQARSSRKIEIADGIPFTAILKEIKSSYLEEKQMGILRFGYEVDCGDENIKKIDDTLYFDENNERGFNFNEEKLNTILEQYQTYIADENYEDVKSIAKSLQHLVGSKVLLVQKTRGDYKNYTIDHVIGK